MAHLLAQAPLDEDSPWPRARSVSNHTVTLHLPEVERWTSNSFTARAVVEVTSSRAKEGLLGVVWFEAHGRVDRTNRTVTLERFDLTKARFPEASDKGSNAVAAVREVLPSGARTVSLDYLITALGFVQAAARQGPEGLNHTPPEIFWVTNDTILVRIDGAPVLQPIADISFERVINTPALLVRNKTSAKFYLAGETRWYAAGAIDGPWSLAQAPPPEVAALAPAATNSAPASEALPIPRIIVSTSPAELVITAGLPDYRPITGTALQYAADTDSQLFFHTQERQFYLLLSGRWFKTDSLNGPWSHVAPGGLPSDFARIPSGSPQGAVLASVPGTPQAELAVLANSVPTTATVNRLQATLEVAYDGEPQFKPIDGTSLSYALNAALPVVRAGDSFYALEDGVWFVSADAMGPWTVAAEIPEEIYSIPPSSPVYYATFARVYQADENEVEVGYTPGYQGSYEDEGTVVYGTGWNYQSWTSTQYYGWGWTYGYGYLYVPWYQWWLWRPWWSQPGGLRAALIENIYDRWQGRPGVAPHDRSDAAAKLASSGFAGHPALYGRFRGGARPAAMSLPANTLAVNPYTRPTASVRPREVPQGAQLLSALRQTPSGGRDLYASPDGNVYLRKPDGWYRREPGGGWGFVAPTQGSMDRSRPATARGAQPPGAVYRPAVGGNVGAGPNQTVGGRATNTGYQARPRDVAALERQYYARSLAQMRARQSHAPAKVARPTRTGGRRR